MSDNQEQAPVEQTQQPVAAGVDFSAQVELLKAKNQELIAEKQKVKANFDDLQKQLDTLQQERAQQKQSKLQEQGQYQDLWKEANDANSQLKSQIAEMQAALEAKDQQFSQAQIKSAALNSFAQAGVINPDHMFSLVGDKLRIEDGNVSCCGWGRPTVTKRVRRETEDARIRCGLYVPRKRFSWYGLSRFIRCRRWHEQPLHQWKLHRNCEDGN